MLPLSLSDINDRQKPVYAESRGGCGHIIKKIPPNLPLPKGWIIPLFGKEG